MYLCNRIRSFILYLHVFLLDESITGDRRLQHLTDRLRQCQQVFFNLQLALTTIEKQRHLFLEQERLSRMLKSTANTHN
jgi:hypothetical protein